MPRSFAAALAIALTVSAATNEPKLPPKVQAVVDLARSTPPEFHAWSLLKLLQAQALGKDRAVQRQFIEQVYELAGAAQTRYPMQALSGVPRDSVSAVRGLGGALGLDSLSLQIRAVQLMLPLDKARAREMFTDIPRPSIAAIGCEDDLIPRLTDFYQTLGRVAQQAFTAKERQREDHVSFLLDYVAGIGSPAQLVPVATMLQTLALNADQKQLLYAKFGSALESVTPDDASFAEVTAGLTPLLSADMMPAFQRFIARHSAAPRCRQPREPRDRAPQLTVGATGKTPAPSDYKGEMLGQDAQAKRIQQMAYDLRVHNSRVLTEADRGDPAWQLAFGNYEDALSQWQKPDSESEAAFFHEKVAGWMMAADLAATAETRGYALGEAARVMATSPLENSNPGEWFFQVVQGISGRQPGDELLRAYEQSGNPVLAVYAALVRLAGPGIIH